MNPNKESPVDMMMSMVSNWCDAGDIEWCVCVGDMMCGG